ncbi:MAG TPA: asparagine synthase B, partial [Steroidobacteraceae bacterium]|nr:asparagine synthase B [Steroidobacteraceae bacterium]
MALAHRRLSILDLSEAAHQPMVFGSHVLSYNGELYNHESLRAGMPGPWHSTGDTEVLLHLLSRDGSACLSQLVGMFAFAYWDADRRRLLLARDRLGIKPLYYCLLQEG